MIVDMDAKKKSERELEEIVLEGIRRNRVVLERLAKL